MPFLPTFNAVAQTTKFRAGMCARTVSMGVSSPFAVAVKVGWSKQEGLANGNGLAVPTDSPIQKASDLKGTNISVTNLASAGVIISRARVTPAGLDPDRDVSIVVARQGTLPAALLKSREVQAPSQFDTQYALIANAGL